MIKQILGLGSGLYCWAIPDLKSILWLQQIQRAVPESTVPIKYEGSSDFHCTVLYCKKPEPPFPDLELPQLSGYAVGEPDIWVDHKQRQFLLLKLVAPELQAANYEFQRHGLPHSYPDYQPHVTLGYFTQPIDQQKLCKLYRTVWAALGTPEITWEPQLRASSIC